MSSFHPLGGSTSNQHPLHATDIRFHNDQDDADNDSWSPPALPGEQRIPEKLSRQRKMNQSAFSPLENQLDPLLNTLPSASAPRHDSTSNTGELTCRGRPQGSETNDGGSTFGTGSWARSGDNSNGYHENSSNDGTGGFREDAAKLAGPAGSAAAKLPGAGPGAIARPVGSPYAGASRVTLAAVHTLKVHSYFVPTFCDACSQLLIGIMQQGLQCEVCRMNLHPECQSTPCSTDHRCRPPETVRISAGVDGTQLDGGGMKGDYASSKSGGAVGPSRAGVAPAGGSGVGAGAAGQGNAAMGPVEDPLNSDWHRTLMSQKQLWVPDADAMGCMVCNRTFNLVIRRHHCRRCGACMCSWCSHMAVSDKILAVQQNTGAVTRISTADPVRCCTPCTRVLDQHLTQALQRRGWGPRQGAAAAQTLPPAVATASSSPERTTRPSNDGNDNEAGGRKGAGVGYDNSRKGPGYGDRDDYTNGGERHGRPVGADINRDPLAAKTDYSPSCEGGFGVGNFSVGDNVAAAENGYNDSRPRSGSSFRSGYNSHSTPALEEYIPPHMQRQESEDASSGVPSWLGKSTLRTAPSRRALLAGSSFMGPVEGGGDEEPSSTCFGQEDDDDDVDEGEGVFGNPGRAGEVEEATDWSTSGAVV